jgi:hypothetical protein
LNFSLNCYWILHCNRKNNEEHKSTRSATEMKNRGGQNCHFEFFTELLLNIWLKQRKTVKNREHREVLLTLNEKQNCHFEFFTELLLIFSLNQRKTAKNTEKCYWIFHWDISQETAVYATTQLLLWRTENNKWWIEKNFDGFLSFVTTLDLPIRNSSGSPSKIGTKLKAAN